MGGFSSLIKRAFLKIALVPTQENDQLPGTFPSPTLGDGLWLADGGEFLQHERYINEEMGEMGKGNPKAYKKQHKFKNMQVRNMEDLERKNIIDLDDIENEKAKEIKQQISEVVKNVH